MKKLKIISIFLLCLLLTACSNEFAKKEYDSDEKIAQKTDHYSKKVSVFKSIDGGFSFTVSEFDGRETLWTEKVKEDQDIEIEVSFSISEGQAKIVHIDEDGNVTTLLECQPDTVTDGFVMKTVALKSGQNRLKIVGYDCEDVDLKMLFEKEE